MLRPVSLLSLGKPPTQETLFGVRNASCACHSYRTFLSGSPRAKTRARLVKGWKAGLVGTAGISRARLLAGATTAGLNPPPEHCMQMFAGTPLWVGLGSGWPSLPNVPEGHCFPWRT